MNGMLPGVGIFNVLSRTAPVAAGKSMAPEVLLLDYMNMLGKMPVVNIGEKDD